VSTAADNQKGKDRKNSNTKTQIFLANASNNLSETIKMHVKTLLPTYVKDVKSVNIKHFDPSAGNIISSAASAAAAAAAAPVVGKNARSAKNSSGAAPPPPRNEAGMSDKQREMIVSPGDKKEAITAKAFFSLPNEMKTVSASDTSVFFLCAEGDMNLLQPRVFIDGFNVHLHSLDFKPLIDVISVPEGLIVVADLPGFGAKLPTDEEAGSIPDALTISVKAEHKDFVLHIEGAKRHLYRTVEQTSAGWKFSPKLLECKPDNLVERRRQASQIHEQLVLERHIEPKIASYALRDGVAYLFFKKLDLDPVPCEPTN